MLRFIGNGIGFTNIGLNPDLAYADISLFLTKFQNIAGLAIQRFADGIERTEAHRLGFPRF